LNDQLIIGNAEMHELNMLCYIEVFFASLPYGLIWWAEKLILWQNWLLLKGLSDCNVFPLNYGFWFFGDFENVLFVEIW